MTKWSQENHNIKTFFTNLLNPTKGKVIIDGYSVKDKTKKALSNVGALIETPGLYPYLTPSELLQMFCELRMVSNCDMKSVLEEVGMYEWRNKKVGKFSALRKHIYC